MSAMKYSVLVGSQITQKLYINSQGTTFVDIN
jgi:hypothetical protein